MEKFRFAVGKPNKPMPPAFGVFTREKVHGFDEFARAVERGFPAYNELRGKAEWAEIQHALGQTALSAGRFREAGERFNRSMNAFRELGLPGAQGDVARSLGELSSAMKDDGAAIKLFDEASRLHAEAGEEAGLSFDLIAMARHHAARKNAAKAVYAFEQAWSHQPLAGERALNLMHQAEALLDLKSAEGAVACIRLAEELSGEGVPPEIREEVQARGNQLRAKLGADFHKIGNSLGSPQSARRKAIFQLTGQ